MGIAATPSSTVISTTILPLEKTPVNNKNTSICPAAPDFLVVTGSAGCFNVTPAFHGKKTRKEYQVPCRLVE